ncbi:MAG: alpha/beta hydrolase, partial [Calditrichaeota bacterium]
PEDEPLLRSRFPTAEIVTISGAGHWVHYEAPEAFLRVVDKFLES